VSKHENKRQAVVIIHGMGEQRPMDTLRSFVEGIRQYLLKTDESEKNTVIRSKPDGISDIYETRRLSLSASRNRPITDFIGGPMQRLFGPGVRDISVKRKSIWFFPGGHTSYWSRTSEASLATIVNALHLRNK
jgi:hypothetical protein